MSQKPKRKCDWEGLKVRSLRVLRNGNIKIPSGSKFTVTRNYGGLTLESDQCPNCGVSVYITRVPEHDVEILED